MGSRRNPRAGDNDLLFRRRLAWRCLVLSRRRRPNRRHACDNHAKRCRAPKRFASKSKHPRPLAARFFWAQRPAAGSPGLRLFSATLSAGFRIDQLPGPDTRRNPFRCCPHTTRARTSITGSQRRRAGGAPRPSAPSLNVTPADGIGPRSKGNYRRGGEDWERCGASPDSATSVLSSAPPIVAGRSFGSGTWTT